MRKQAFLDQLRGRLGGIPQSELNERLSFYSEMIDDRIEEGLSEEEAILAVGSVEEIAEQIISDIPLSKIAKERIKPKRQIKAWEIVLLILGAPVWLPLIAAAFIVILAVYVVLWSLILSIWAIFVAVTACAPYGAATGIAFFVKGNGLVGMTLISAGIICAGLAIFLFFGCMAATKGIITLTKRIALSIKKRFVRKEKCHE